VGRGEDRITELVSGKLVLPLLLGLVLLREE
jgi:hypothetical protein